MGPYLKHRQREVLFREVVMATLGLKESPQEEYCRKCKEMRLGDCRTCDPSTIKRME